MTIIFQPIFGERFVKQLKKHTGRFALMTDQTVASFYGASFLDFMKTYGFDCTLITFPQGEHSKTRETKVAIEDQLLDHKFGKDTLLIALGGGVTTDIGGFVAATYLRGIPYLSIPTSLLGMVDASIGGKTGVNVPQAKNAIGAFYPPLAIFIDLSMLSTLPQKHMLSGTAEILKAGLIANKSLFERLEENSELWKEKEPNFLRNVVETSIQVKKQIIRQDPKEKGKRRILNFGHTIGHAIETLEDYSLSHGEAIAMGMVTEALIAQKIGNLSRSDFEAIYTLIKTIGFPLNLSSKVTLSLMKEAISRDKKTKEGIPRFVILNGIGKVDHFKGAYCSAVDPLILEEALGWMVAEFNP